MNVVVDVIEAYSEHIGLPIMLINSNGQLEYTVDDYLITPLLIDEKQRYINKLLRVTEKLKSPTIMSVSGEVSQSDIFYILTPIFELNEQSFFLVAGHFHIRNAVGETRDNNKVTDNYLDEYEVDDILVKVKNLFQLLLSKAEVRKRFHAHNKLAEVLDQIGNIKFVNNNENSYIKLILDEYIKLKEIDFIGFATKDSNDAFIITYIIGEQVYHLLDKKFYIGEGVLGKAAIYGEDFYWHVDENPRRNEFMHRYGVFPNQLFGFTLKHKGEVEKVVFGGCFSNKIIEPAINSILKCIIQISLKQVQTDLKLMDVTTVQSLFTNWIDLVNVTNTKNDKKQILFKILDLCQTLNFDQFACVTTYDHEFIYRGHFNAVAADIHQHACHQLKYNSQLKLWINDYCIHYAFDYGENKLNLFTVSFSKDTNMHYVTNIFEMIEKTVNEQFVNRYQQDSNQQNPLFDILFDSMKEMNIEKSELSNAAIWVLDKLQQMLFLDFGLYIRLVNISKVIPYSYNFLSKQINETEEWKMLQRYKILVDYNQLTSFTEIEFQIIAFIDQVIVHNVEIEQVKYIESKLLELCISLYTQYMQFEHMPAFDMRNVVEQDKGNDQKHLHDVINTLELTTREKQVLSLLMEGMNNNEVGDNLKISAHTVKNHVTNIFKKLNVTDRMQATAKVYRIKFGGS